VVIDKSDVVPTSPRNQQPLSNILSMSSLMEIPNEFSSYGYLPKFDPFKIQKNQVASDEEEIVFVDAAIIPKDLKRETSPVWNEDPHVSFQGPMICGGAKEVRVISPRMRPQKKNNEASSMVSAYSLNNSHRGGMR